MVRSNYSVMLSIFQCMNFIFIATRTECVDKDERFCSHYVQSYGDRFCDQDWFISDSGRYGCKLSCKLCNELEPTEDDEAIEATSLAMIPTTTACEDVNAFCRSYKNIYGDRLCNEDEEWNQKIKYECQKTCGLC